MTPSPQLRFDEIGYWSEVKLDIISKYARAYSTVIAAQTKPKMKHVYIDGFSGAGEHISKHDGKMIPGSPLNALNVNPPFCEYYLVDLNPLKTDHLNDLIGERDDVFIRNGDCNCVLLDQVFPNVKYEDYSRGLCVLDPYGLDLDWQVINTAGQMKSIEIFLNFPVLDMNRNVFWRNPEGVRESDIERMNRFWGDDSWKKAVYRSQTTLFGEEEVKNDSEVITEAFRNRLMDEAGFKFVPNPMPMRNSNGGIVYYLFFASQNEKGKKIVEDIFGTYRKRGYR